MQELPFSIMLDATNDNDLAKIYPITVRIFNTNYSSVMTKFFDMNLIEVTMLVLQLRCFQA